MRSTSLLLGSQIEDDPSGQLLYTRVISTLMIFLLAAASHVKLIDCGLTISTSVPVGSLGGCCSPPASPDSPRGFVVHQVVVLVTRLGGFASPTRGFPACG